MLVTSNVNLYYVSIIIVSMEKVAKLLSQSKIIQQLVAIPCLC